jgi:hypothetical protein
MAETIDQNALREAELSELELRRERAEIPERIAVASSRIQHLRGGGHRDGDPELEAALQETRDLVDRERALPDLIVAAVAKRCRLRAEQLVEEEWELTLEAESLQDVASRAHEALEKARRKASEARSRVESNTIARERLRQEARPFEDFARAAQEAEGEKRFRLLESARTDGLLLPFNSFEADV